MQSETIEPHGRDLRIGGTVSLAVHAALFLAVGASLSHARVRFTPPEMSPLRLEIDLPVNVAEQEPAEGAAGAPAEGAAPLAPSMPRPVASRQPERRILPPEPAPDSAPAETPALAVPFADVVPSGPVALAVASSGPAKSAFATAAPAAAYGGRTGGSGIAAGVAAGGDGVGIEGPVSVRRAIKPLYPGGSRQRGEEGTVVLEAVVDAEGRTSSLSLLSSSQYAELDRAAMRAVTRAVFNPATEDGRPVEARARITIIFRLTD